MMKNKDGKAHVKVFRFDPTQDKKPKYQTYDVPLEGSVLDALQYIYEHYDSSLAFRFGCSGASYERCGACSVVVNGQPALTCRRLVERAMTVEPHPKFQVIRDLVIDFDKEQKTRKKITSSVKISIDLDKCTACRDCVLLCPVKVFEIRKVGSKGKAVATDPASCCGQTCKQCATFCTNGAIRLTSVKK